MIRSEHLDQIASALSVFQSKVAAIPKTAANPFFKSKYADLPSVVAVAAPLLTESGLSVTQILGHDDAGDSLTTLVLHKSGQYLGGTMQLRPVKNDPQAQGSATTYGRRYAYMAALGLVADEDDDGEAASGRPGARSNARASSASASSARSARQKPARQNGKANTSEARSEPDNGSDDAATALASDEALKELKRQYKAAVGRLGDKATKDAYTGIVKEVGAESTDKLTEDQATWVILKLRDLKPAEA